MLLAISFQSNCGVCEVDMTNVLFEQGSVEMMSSLRKSMNRDGFKSRSDTRSETTVLGCHTRSGAWPPPADKLASAIPSCLPLSQTVRSEFDELSIRERVLVQFAQSGYPLQWIDCSCDDRTLKLWGRVTRFFFKQIALEIALTLADTRQIELSIDVVDTLATANNSNDGSTFEVGASVWDAPFASLVGLRETGACSD